MSDWEGASHTHGISRRENDINKGTSKRRINVEAFKKLWGVDEVPNEDFTVGEGPNYQYVWRTGI